MDSQALAAFLRSRREATRPEDVGMVRRERRRPRTPGLRREEVAERAGVSVDYYERLEQSRAAHPSAQVIEALAEALGLAEPDRDHLERLAGYAVPRVRQPSSEVPPGVSLLLDRLGPVAGYVCDATQAVVAWNKLAASLITDLELAPPEERTVYALGSRPGATVCTAPPDAGTGGVDFGAEGGANGEGDGRTVDGAGVGGFAAQTAAQLRTALARYPDDVELRQVAERMAARDPAFEASWNGQRVRTPNTVRKLLLHPVEGSIEVDCQSLEIPDTDLRLMLYSAEPGSESYEKLLRLSPT